MNLKFTIALVVLVQTLIAQPLNRPAPEVVNTPFDEKNPVISPDGKTLYVTIGYHPDNLGGKKDPGDIWYCTRTATNEWSSPVHAGALINDRAFNSIAGFSADGSQMVLMGHYDPQGNSPKSQGISVSRRNGGIWARPENVKIPYFQNKSLLSTGYITPDLNILVYAAEAYGSYGVEDIFVCRRKDNGEWSEPKNVGPKINSGFQELSPSLSADGMTLYFSTNRKGRGSFDVYSATRLDDTWTNWSEPANFEAINSTGRELYYRESSATGSALYIVVRDSDQYGDIRQFGPDTPVVQDTTSVASPVAATSEQTPDTTSSHTVMLRGKVVNAKTGEPIPATIAFEAESQFVQAPPAIDVPATGYSTSLPSSTRYVVKVEARGFISTREKLDIATVEMKDLEMNFKLQPIEVGTTVELKDVLFEQSRTALLPASYPELDLVVSFMKANPAVRIELAGHTDNRGIPSQNVKLSQGRVDKVKEYLISKGVEGRRISGKGYGGNKPIASNDTEETRKLNRRVEFTIRKN